MLLGRPGSPLDIRVCNIRVLITLALILLLGLAACGPKEKALPSPEETAQPLGAVAPDKTPKTPPELPGPGETVLSFETVFHEYQPVMSSDEYPELDYYKCREPGLFVISRPEEVSVLDRWLPAKQLLSLDYDQYFVVAVFQGCCEAARDVTVKYITHRTDRDEVVDVYVELQIPEPEQVVVLEVQSPYHVVQVEKGDLPAKQCAVFNLVANGELVTSLTHYVP